jgi:hypothetical protein
MGPLDDCPKNRHKQSLANAPPGSYAKRRVWRGILFKENWHLTNSILCSIIVTTNYAGLLNERTTPGNERPSFDFEKSSAGRFCFKFSKGKKE